LGSAHRRLRFCVTGLAAQPDPRPHGRLAPIAGALGAFLRRLKARVGAPKAITATAHKLARLVYSLLKDGTAYVTQGMDEYEQRYRERAVRSLSRRARELGYEVVQAAQTTAEPALS
jgi:hypothetical protein